MFQLSNGLTITIRSGTVAVHTPATYGSYSAFGNTGSSMTNYGLHEFESHEFCERFREYHGISSFNMIKVLDFLFSKDPLDEYQDELSENCCRYYQ